MTERTYGEREIKDLLERAAHLQAASADDGAGPGLTLAELEQIAAESGIDPQFLRLAAHEAEAGITPRDTSGQTDTHIFVERTVPGTLTEAQWESVVLRLRERFGSDLALSFGLGPQYGHGVTETLGTAREWRHTTSAGVSTTVTIRSVEGVQHLRLQRRVGLASPRLEGLMYGFFAALLAGLVGAAVTEAVWGLFLTLAAALALAAPAIEFLDRRWRGGKLDELNEVADDIANIIHDPAAQSEAPRSDAVAEIEAPAFDLDVLPDLGPAASQLSPLRGTERS